MSTATAPRIPGLPNLVAVRERKGISLDQIARSTKISFRYLEAIENADFEQLPGGVFSSSYIRQYARAIDYDEWDLLAYFQTSMQPQAQAEGASGQHKFLGFFNVPEPLFRWFRA
ncbi:MAG TPA: helix-turn-helix domain-containing protein [Bryobacteraceae bacterium]